MHESGMIVAMIDAARREADARGGELRVIHVRLGVLAGGSPEHLREHFVREAHRLGLFGLGLEIEQDPDDLGGITLTSIEVAESAE